MDEINNNRSTDQSTIGFETLDSSPINVPQKIKHHKTGELFFRARTINNLLDLQKWNRTDFEALPSHKIKNYGRLNKPHEEMLYLSSTADQTLKEINYNYQILVIIAAYQTIKPFCSLQIAQRNSDLDHKSDILVKQIDQLFHQPATANNNEKTTTIRDRLYQITSINDIQAWSYPTQAIQDSKQTKKNYNLAIYPGIAKQYLQFKGAIVISEANKSGYKHIDFCFDQNYRLDYLKSYPELIKFFDLDKDS